jgi:hypothetical protein
MHADLEAFALKLDLIRDSVSEQSPRVIRAATLRPSTRAMIKMQRCSV